MSLAAKSKQGPPPRRFSQCTVGLTLDGLDKAEADAFRSMLANPAWSGSAIAAAYREEYPNGYELRDGTVNRHRNGGCTCPRADT